MAANVRHPIFARVYDRMSRADERHGGAELRAELLGGLTGRVLEVGAGNGLNFAHYPTTVSEVIAVEPEAHLRKRASEAAADAPVPVTVRDGTADALPTSDSSCDAAVASLVLCSVPDPTAALAELRRILRPGGELRFYEHVVANRPGLARVQRIVDAAIWPRVGGGCHTARDTLVAIERSGFTIRHSRRFTRPSFPGDPSAPHVLGIADVT